MIILSNFILLENDPLLLIIVGTLVGVTMLSRNIRERENNGQAERRTSEETVQAERRMFDEETVNSNTRLSDSNVTSIEWPFEIDLLRNVIDAFPLKLPTEVHKVIFSFLELKPKSIRMPISAEEQKSTMFAFLNPEEMKISMFNKEWASLVFELFPRVDPFYYEILHRGPSRPTDLVYPTAMLRNMLNALFNSLNFEAAHDILSSVEGQGLCLKISVVFFYTLGRVSYKSVLYGPDRRIAVHPFSPEQLEDLDKQIEDWFRYVYYFATECYLFTSYVKLKWCPSKPEFRAF